MSSPGLASDVLLRIVFSEDTEARQDDGPASLRAPSRGPVGSGPWASGRLGRGHRVAQCRSGGALPFRALCVALWSAARPGLGPAGFRVILRWLLSPSEPADGGRAERETGWRCSRTCLCLRRGCQPLGCTPRPAWGLQRTHGPAEQDARRGSMSSACHAHATRRGPKDLASFKLQVDADSLTESRLPGTPGGPRRRAGCTRAAPRASVSRLAGRVCCPGRGARWASAVDPGEGRGLRSGCRCLLCSP